MVVHHHELGWQKERKNGPQKGVAIFKVKVTVRACVMKLPLVESLKFFELN